LDRTDPTTPPDDAPEPASPLPPPPREGWASRFFHHPVTRSAVILLAFVVIQAIVAIALYALAAPSGLLDPEDPMAIPGWFLILAFALTVPPMVAFTWAFVRVIDRRSLASIGARWPDGGPARAARQAALVPLATFALIGLWAAGVAAFASFRFGGLSEELLRGPGDATVGLSPALFVGLLLLGFLLQGGLEEWIVRGYVYHALKERWSAVASAVASSVLFSLLHAFNPDVSWVALVNIVAAGLVLAALVERSGSLWSAVLAHGFWNFGLACVLSLPVSGLDVYPIFDVSIAGPEWLTGGEFGPEGSLLLTALGLPLAFLLWPRGSGRARGTQEVSVGAGQGGGGEAGS
jgi:uncharacterized protein